MTTKSPWSSRDVLQRDVAALVPAARGSGRAAPRGGAKKVPRPTSWPGEAHRVAFVEQRWRRRGSRPCPSRAAACPRAICAAVVDDVLHRGCSLKFSGTVGEALAPAASASPAARAVSAASVHFAFDERRPVDRERRLEVGAGSGLLVCLPASSASRNVVISSSALVRGDHAFAPPACRRRACACRDAARSSCTSAAASPTARPARCGRACGSRRGR